MKTDSMNKKQKITVDTFNHNLEIECLKNNIYIYNDRTGESIQVSYDFIDFCFSVNKPTLSEYVRLLSRFFTYDVKFNELLFQTVNRENEYLKIKGNLGRVLGVSCYSTMALLQESLEYKQIKEVA